jgi:hypothetical protein
VPETMHGRWTIGVVSVRHQSREHSSGRSLRARNGIASPRVRFAGQEGSGVVSAIAALASGNGDGRGEPRRRVQVRAVASGGA